MIIQLLSLVVLPLQFSLLSSGMKNLCQDMIITNLSISHDLKVQVTQLHNQRYFLLLPKLVGIDSGFLITQLENCLTI